MVLRRLDNDSLRKTAPLVGLMRSSLFFVLAGTMVETAAAQGRPLTSLELDSVTAGEVAIEAAAQAFATGPNATTRTNAETIVREQTVTSVSLRRLTPDLTIVTERESKDARVALATAEARAEGANPRVSCSTNIAPPGAVSASVAGKLTLRQPGLAYCQCLQIGILTPAD